MDGKFDVIAEGVVVSGKLGGFSDKQFARFVMVDNSSVRAFFRHDETTLVASIRKPLFDFDIMNPNNPAELLSAITAAKVGSEVATHILRELEVTIAGIQCGAKNKALFAELLERALVAPETGDLLALKGRCFTAVYLIPSNPGVDFIHIKDQSGFDFSTQGEKNRLCLCVQTKVDGTFTRQRFLLNFETLEAASVDRESQPLPLEVLAS